MFAETGGLEAYRGALPGGLIGLKLEREVKLDKAGESETFICNDRRLKPPLPCCEFGGLLQNERPFGVGDIHNLAVSVSAYVNPDNADHTRGFR